MADNRKEVERAELHRTIWAIADELRGSVDGWDFKSYILGMLFYRYISENITAYINKGEWETGNKSFNYADLDDATAEGAREEMVSVKGFFILPSQLFENVCKVCDADPNLNMTLEGIFSSIENSARGTESEDDFKGLFADLDEELRAAYEAIGEGGMVYSSFEHSFWVRHKGQLIRVM